MPSRRRTQPAAPPVPACKRCGALLKQCREVAGLTQEELAAEAGYSVVGTNFGKSATPEWALNLVANPRVRVEWGGEEFRAEARAVPIQDPLWEAFEAMWPAYATYRARATDRTIGMFRLGRY